MGLDGVEFVMALEEAFQIAIPDEVAEHLPTPGDVVRYVRSRVGGDGNAPGCLDQRAFYRLRRAAVQVFDVPRAAVTPSTLWQGLLSPFQARHDWQLLHQAAAIPYWPGLTLFGRVPKAIASVGDTARHLAAHTPAVFMWAGETWTQAAVEGVVTRLMRDQLGITEFKWESQFGRDLKVD